tara:strand:- start:81 stop:251 length:171 start_codon:yes stop_codon:yes gene_type:complete
MNNKEAQALAKIGLTSYANPQPRQADRIKQYFEQILRQLNKLEEILKGNGNQVSQD